MPRKGLAGLHGDMSCCPPQRAVIPHVLWYCQRRAEHALAGLGPPAWAEEEDGKAAWAQGTTQAQGVRMLCQDEALLSLGVPSETTHEREPGRCPILSVN